MPRGGRGGRSRSGSLPVAGHGAAHGLRSLTKAFYMLTRALQGAPTCCESRHGPTSSG